MTMLHEHDNELATLISQEQERQKLQLQLIPSENYVSKNVLEAVGSVVMNKYSEGQPRKRYYQGNDNIDGIELLAKKRALELYGLDPEEWDVNVQAVTGSVANLAVLSALLEPGDRILSMYLYDGGHLSHGWQLPDGKKVSFSSRIFDVSYYQVDKQSERFDYNEIERIAQEVKPKLIISGGTAYPPEIDYERMAHIAHEVGAYYLSDIAHEAGLVAAGVNAAPFPYADVVTMTTRKTLRGPVGAMIFSRREDNQSYHSREGFNDRINRAVFPGLQGGPMNHSIAGIAACLKEASTNEFRSYAKQVVSNAIFLASELDGYGFHIVSGGTEKHLILIDLQNKNTRGRNFAIALEEANIITNANTHPNEQGSPFYPSGLRLGTPAVTSRGMKEPEMEKIASWINTIGGIVNGMPLKLGEFSKELEKEKTTLHQIAHEVAQMTANFPVPGID
ncbi:serine hydroxymethyltransferase [candidate division WWE3 bacterium]|uniref:Probable serine hydroxymethyltransferase n=1 Tax=candidate division WWE3 bacterium TaxID=2053526 RepID=A0A955LGL7_UNCKA|nr:serine hydroxymethyltransferase [candidate division WWE3 bacterium]